jgi:hypothetical protein
MKEQIQGVIDRLDKRENDRKLVMEGKTIIEEITAWDGEIIQRKSRSYDDVINFPNKLSAEYLFLRGQIDDQIPIVTRPVIERLKVLDAQWEKLRSEAQRLEERVKTYSETLSFAGVGPIILDR